MHYYAFKINQNSLQFETEKNTKKNAWFAHGSHNHKSKATNTELSVTSWARWLCLHSLRVLQLQQIFRVGKLIGEPAWRWWGCRWSSRHCASFQMCHTVKESGEQGTVGDDVLWRAVPCWSSFPLVFSQKSIRSWCETTRYCTLLLLYFLRSQKLIMSSLISNQRR
jgi:hypothetical protein